MTSRAHNYKVAYFGIAGSFTYLAADTYFQKTPDYISCTTFRKVFEQVRDGLCDYGVIPIENTLAGSIYENYDFMREFNLVIVGEVKLRIEHALMVNTVRKSPDIDSLKTVYSHQKAIEQCSFFLDSHPTIVAKTIDDTATAAKYVADAGDATIAAISHPNNAKIYGLRILQNNIENNNMNYTRFLVVGRESVQNVNANKCTILLKLPHVVGSLSKALTYLADSKTNLMNIESRPLVDRPFEYVFYLDILFDPHTQDITQILDGFKQYASDFSVLGVYQKESDLT